ncbi:hypothetical protein EYF80_054404 [Liparis tanakae]|uniref:Uncharacterized protein n=1 Tax=Liparis tanakae TaxID=230148 RepID=A0A4Z2F2R9_9TELE|nr:hypothetical protein EYF80_054404 [Liparis tanakae]
MKNNFALEGEVVKGAGEGEEGGRGGGGRRLTGVRYVVPIRSVELVVGLQDLLEQLGVVLVVEGRTSWFTRPVK